MKSRLLSFTQLFPLLTGLMLISSCAAFNKLNSSNENASIDGEFKISSVSPSTAKAGDIITVKGGVFLKGITLTIQDMPKSISSLNSSKLQITIPANATAGRAVFQLTQGDYNQTFEFMVLNADGSVPDGNQAVTLTTEKVAHGVRANVSGDAKTRQIIEGDKDSNLSGGSISFPPGSIAVSSNVSFTSGANIATDSTANSLGIAGGFVSSGISASISADDATTLENPYSLQLPIPSGASLIGRDLSKLAIISRYRKHRDSGHYLGLYRRDELTVKDDKVILRASYFGTYQVVFTKTKVEEHNEVPEKSDTAPEENSAQTGDDDDGDDPTNTIPSNMVLVGQTGAFHQRGVLITAFQGNTQETQLSGINQWFLQAAPVAGSPSELYFDFIPSESVITP